MVKWRIGKEESGIKLLAFLKDKLENQYSTRLLKRALESNLCLVNGTLERFGTTILGKGDEVDFCLNEMASFKAVNISDQTFKPTILYEDSYFLFIDKPSGVVSESSELLQALKGKKPYLELIHRLDKETSGVLTFAKTAEAKEKIIVLFRERKIQKEYLAVVDGIPKKNSGNITNYLGKLYQHENIRHEGQSFWGSVEKEKGKIAITNWKIKEKNKDTACLTCFPITGRTHQIRIHLSDIGHPILGDKLYGKKFKSIKRPTRCLLHACSLSFLHPFTGDLLLVKAPIPEDFRFFISPNLMETP